MTNLTEVIDGKEVLKNEYARELINENNEYKNRIQQAIEFIEKYKKEWYEYDEVQEDMNKLLSIIGGEYK